MERIKYMVADSMGDWDLSFKIFPFKVMVLCAKEEKQQNKRRRKLKVNFIKIGLMID